MATPVCKVFRSVRMEEEEAMTSERQGIGSILGSDPEVPKSAASLRRTLSADMSSKKWLSRHGVSPLKKVASSEEFPVVCETDSSSSSEAEEEHEDGKKELERPGQVDIWSSILLQKANDSTMSSSSQAPYVHPLVKRSASSLNEKSLEICTESLGSETGSDCFSSYPPSETGEVEEEDVEEEHEQKQEKESESEEEMGAVKYCFYASKRSSPRSFPPPLPSLSRRDGPCFHMRSHRKDGRLVLEAVPVPSHSYFHAQRQNGRLLLSVINSTPSEPQTQMYSDEEEIEEEEMEEEEEEEEFEEEEEIEIADEKESGDKDGGILAEVKVNEATSKLPNGIMNFHRSALVMNKLMSLSNENPSWPKKLGKIVDLEEDTAAALPQSLPPQPRVARMISPPPAVSASLNPYEYYWRSKPVALTLIKRQASLINTINNNRSNSIVAKNFNPQNKEQLILLRGSNRGGEHFVPVPSGCKEARSKPVLISEPYCIATS